MCEGLTYCSRLKKTGTHSGMEAITPDSSRDLHSIDHYSFSFCIISRWVDPVSCQCISNMKSTEVLNPIIPLHLCIRASKRKWKHNKGDEIERKEREKKREGGWAVVKLRATQPLPSSRDTISLGGRHSDTKN